MPDAMLQWGFRTETESLFWRVHRRVEKQTVGEIAFSTGEVRAITTPPPSPLTGRAAPKEKRRLLARLD